MVELRYFGGMREDEIADVLKMSARTVRRYWDFAKSWITRELSRWAGQRVMCLSAITLLNSWETADSEKRLPYLLSNPFRLPAI